MKTGYVELEVSVDNLTQDSAQCWAVVKTAMNVRVT
jgi:hypothetical protein